MSPPPESAIELGCVDAEAGDDGRRAVTILAYAACILIVAACVACIISDVSGHQVRCLPRVIATHPAWWARYARARRHPAPGPGRDDGEELTDEETRVLDGLAGGRDIRSRT